MRKDWEYKKLGEVANVVMGQSPDGSNVNNENGMEFHQGKINFGEQFLMKSDCFTTQVTKVAEKGSILLCVRAPIGIINITDRDICIGRGLCAIKEKTEVDNLFLYYYLLNKKLYFEKNSTGSTFKAISSKVVLHTPIFLPPKPTQLAIVAELDKLNEMIRLKKQQLEDYDQLAQSIFYEMFGDPVENEKGWEVKKISEVSIYYNGKAHENDIDESGKYILINSKFISSEGSVLKRTATQHFPLYKNDVVMVLSDLPNGKALGKCCLITKDDIYSLNQRICCFRGFKGDSHFFKYMINRHPYFLSFDDGKGQTNLRKKDVENCPIPLPPLPLQQQFAARIEAIERQKQQVSETIKDLETLLASRMQYWFD